MEKGPKQEDQFLKKVATIVLAGGKGTRLHPLTLHRCKPAVTFGGRYRLIDIPLSNSINSSINQIYVISQYFAADLHQHILTTYQFDAFHSGRLELLTPEETTKGKAWFKGTADAVRQTLDYILRCPAEWFLILSGDQLYNMDLLDMLSFAKEQDADLTIASMPVQVEEAKRMGLLRTDANHMIQSFHEKPQDPAILEQYRVGNNGHYLASMGMYVFKRSALVEILLQVGDDFGHDLIPTFIERGNSAAYVYSGYWEDIGTVASYFKANLLLTRGEGLNTYEADNQIYSSPQHLPSPLINGTKVERSIISQGGIINAKEVTDSVIGVRALVKKGTVLRNTILSGNRTYHPFLNQALPSEQYYSIGENCLIENAIIDEECRIGDNVELTNRDNLETFDGDGIYIRDGIIIVTSGTEIPDGFKL